MSDISWPSSTATWTKKSGIKLSVLDDRKVAKQWIPNVKNRIYAGIYIFRNKEEEEREKEREYGAKGFPNGSPRFFINLPLEYAPNPVCYREGWSDIDEALYPWLSFPIDRELGWNFSYHKLNIWRQMHRPTKCVHKGSPLSTSERKWKRERLINWHNKP